ANMGFYIVKNSFNCYRLGSSLNHPSPGEKEMTMGTLPTLLRFFATFVLVTGASIASASAADAVGTVTALQNQAKIGGATPSIGTPVHMNDRLSTGAKAR